MQFKITVFFLLFTSFSCFSQDVKPIKMEEKLKNVSVEKLDKYQILLYEKLK